MIFIKKMSLFNNQGLELNRKELVLELEPIFITHQQII